MSFLYLSSAAHLENIRPKWHVIAARFDKPESAVDLHQVGPAVIPAASSAGEIQMTDILLLALGLVFFVLAIGYTYACDRL